MADWFKFYENDLDDERLQWAMTEQPHVAIVYIRLMSRCCRDKVRTLSWKDEELELFSLAGILHISIPIVNQCIGLLKRIGYIEIANGECNLLHWNDRQSEYCKKRERVVRTVSGQYPDSVQTKSDTSPLLSSSLSGKRDCKEREPKVTWDMVRGWLMDARKNGADYTEQEAKSAYLYFQANGWRWGKNPVMDFRAAVERQIQTDRTRNGKSESGQKSMSDLTVKDYQ